MDNADFRTHDNSYAEMPVPLFSPAPNQASPFRSMRGDHAGIRVPNLDTALAWYGEKLDFRLTGSEQSGGLTFALIAPAGDDGFQLELLAGPGAIDRPPHEDLQGSLRLHGWHHIALRVDSVDDTVAELRRRDIKIVGEPFDVAGLRRRIAFFADPWGNLFEVTQPIAG